MNTTQQKNPEDDHPLVSRYVNYLRKDRGLAGNSVLVYTPYAIRNFLLDHIRGRSGEYARLLATALRSFFRFLFFCGDLPTDLSPSIPTVCKPQRTAAPAFLSPHEIDRVISATDRRTLTGRRDRAILLLLAKLGLRAEEIVLLELDDIRWRTGEIIIRGKGRVIEPLPLLAEVGEALARYLRDDHRKDESRRVFRRVYPPYVGLAGPAAVGHIVRAAIARAGVRRPGRGAAHLFRHGLATQMIRSGATLTEIFEVLRDRSLSSTAVYAHVSFEALRAVAGPWPVTGGVQ